MSIIWPDTVGAQTPTPARPTRPPELERPPDEDWQEVALGAAATRQFSIVIRYQVLFTMALAMALAVRRGRWR